MSFLSPAFLLALPLIAVPVLIHLFGKRRREVVRWGAMEFLLASATPRRRLLRLKDLLLMLVRAAVVLALIGALSQPMVSSSRFGSTAPRDVILVVDNSMSTARKLGGGTVFEQELTEAGRLLRQLNGTDMLRVLQASPRPEWLNDSPVSADASHARTLLSRLEEAGPNQGTADMLECVQRAIKAAPAGRDLTRFVTVVTDGQAHGWRADAPGAWTALQTLAKKATPPVQVRVVLAGGGTSPVANLAIEKVTATRAVVGVGQPATLTASVKNTGTSPSQATTLAWSAGEQSLGLSTIPALEPGAGTTLRLSQPFTTPGVVEITCKLAGQDDLALDDSSAFLLEVTRAAPILVVEGETRSDPVQSDKEYFLTALGYGEGTNESLASSAFQPRTIDYQQLANEELTCQCVVLADVPRVSIEVARKLARYVTKGGGLWLALGEQTDVDSFNQVFFEPGTGLSPLALRQPIGDADDHEKFTSLVPPAAEHPATALLADLQRLDIDHVRVYRRHQFGSGDGVSVLLRIEGGAPLAVEKNLGRGRVIVQAVPLGLAWSNLPLCHSFVVMVHEWLWYLTEPSLVKRNLQPGELVQVNRPLDASTGVASVQTPIGWTAQVVGQEEDGRVVFRYPRTQMPGEYSLTLPSGAPEKFLVSRDPEESNLTPLSEPQMAALSEAGGLTFGADPFYQPANQRVPAQPRALAAWVLLGLIVLMVAEAAAAFWISRERHAPVPAVEMEPALRA
jgi:hypothetical protein